MQIQITITPNNNVFYYVQLPWLPVTLLQPT